MDAYKVDYHIYTTHSIGQMRPLDIVKHASELEYDVISITDRNTTDGLPEAEIAGEALNIKIVPGIEILSETDDGTEIEILGYNIDREHEALKDFLRMLPSMGNGKPKPEDAIDVIRKAGGTPVLGNPKDINDLDMILGALKKQKLGGLECFRPDLNEEDTMRLVEYAEKYHLHMTKGSGFCGNDYSIASFGAF